MDKISHTKECINIMQAWLDGEELEACRIGDFNKWNSVKSTPFWNFEILLYRVKPRTPDSIDWSQVNKEFKWMARDEKGDVYLYKNKPFLNTLHSNWTDTNCKSYRADAVSSYQRGNTPWNKSLVERPEGV